MVHMGQGLTAETPFEYPRHRASGIALERVMLLQAVLSKLAKYRSPRSLDVFVNVVGGLRLSDPGGVCPHAGVPARGGMWAVRKCAV